MTRRILAIAIAIVLATLGTVGGLALVLSAESRAQDRISNPVTVAVAAVDIPVGTTGLRIRTDEMVRFVKMPQSSVPDDVMSEINAELDTLMVTSNIATGQLLLRANFGADAAVTGGLALPPDMMAVTVETGVPEQVAGYVQPGSEVAIFVTYPWVQTNGTTTNIERTRLLLAPVTVLAVGTNGRDDDERSSVMVTVAVDQEDAVRLISALNAGTLYLGLLSDSVQVAPGPGVDNTDRGGGTPLFS
jgi:pilus assembly protein CpaB